MRTAIVLDFETRSRCDLKLTGSARYAQDPTTEILCLSFENAEGVVTWPAGPEADMQLRELADNPEIVFVAHNAGFEKDILREIMVPKYGFPDVPNERWHCTLSVCAMKGLPQDLDDVTRILRIGEKDTEGSKFTRSLSKPDKKTGELPELTPEVMARVTAYCESDVAVERKLHNRVGWLQKGEREVWLLDQKINERGVMLDLPFVRAAQKVVDGATEPMAKEFAEITGGLTITQVARIQSWLVSQDVHLPNLQKETLKAVLGSDIDDDEEEILAGEDDGWSLDVLLPGPVHRALSIRQLVGSASIKKLGRMLACVCADGRARRLLQYHGAGPGRWAGRIFQPQNFPRPTVKDSQGNALTVEAVYNAVMTGDHEWVDLVVGPPVQTVVTGLRHALMAAPGCVYISGDYAQIEARIVLALAGQHDKLELFLHGTPYVDMAESIFGRKISKHDDIAEYTIGKNTVLGCGFQMGARKFHLRYAPDRDMDFAKGVIDNYRLKWAPKVPDLWHALEEAAMLAVYTKQPHEAYGVEYRIEDAWLTARLPSGRKLYYYKPTTCNNLMPWKDRKGNDVWREGWYYMARKGGVFKRVNAFGGHLTENVVQGLARDVLVHATFLLEDNGFPVVLTVHDEDLGEPLLANADEKAYKEIMESVQPWVKAMGIPIGVETWTGDRYRK